jgi:hypothetical protein
MHGRVRINVLKGDHIVVLPDDFRRNLSRDDFFKNRHGLLPTSATAFCEVFASRRRDRERRTSE